MKSLFPLRFGGILDLEIWYLGNGCEGEEQGADLENVGAVQVDRARAEKLGVGRNKAVPDEEDEVVAAAGGGGGGGGEAEAAESGAGRVFHGVRRSGEAEICGENRERESSSVQNAAGGGGGGVRVQQPGAAVAAVPRRQLLQSVDGDGRRRSPPWVP